MRIKYFLIIILAILAGNKLYGQDGRRNSREKVDTLTSSVIIGDIRRPELITQSGMLKLIRDDFNFKSTLNTPDVIKTIQMLPGVAQGTEMKSDLYVRGGTGSDNLYLLDNVPVYQPGHFLGMFSIFNTEMLSTVDFYKSGFPGEYGGRLSSVIDVKTKEGRTDHANTMFSAGITDGRFQTEGPIKKGKSSYNIGFRTSWIEAVLRPMLNHFNVDAAYYSNDITKDGHYAFSDLHAKIMWKVSDADKILFNTFFSYDFMRSYEAEKSNLYKGMDNSRWGNAIFSTTWQHKWSEKSNLSLTGYFSDGICDIYNKKVRNNETGSISVRNDNISNIAEAGIKLKASLITGIHKIRYGAALSYHHYGASRNTLEKITQNGKTQENKDIVDNTRRALDFSVFGEDEIQLARWFHLNAAFRYQMYNTFGKTYNFVEPRLSTCFSAGTVFDFKMSYSKMNQTEHLIMSNMTDIPGNFWMPSTKKMKPMQADQYSAEIDFRPNRVWYLNLSGFYKQISGVAEYIGPNKDFPDQDSWEKQFIQGDGRSYGAELFLEFRKGKYDLSTSYTLSWSERKFATAMPGWFPDRFDNRHKISVNAIYKAHELINIYANWTYHTGNRLTLKSYYSPSEINTTQNKVPQYAFKESSSPNNYEFPAYHRLDIGIDFKATTKKGHDYLVSFGCYNVYGRKNPIYATIEPSAYGGLGIRLTSVFPVFPSFRYTMFF